MRAAALAFALLGSAAHAHFFAFDFVTPSGVGSRTDGGFTVVQWVDGPDPTGLAELTFYASRNGFSPFVAAPKDVQFGPPVIPMSDPSNVLVWDARALAPGCYQPFVVVSDQIEGISVRPSAGLVTVDPLDGGNAPPAIWVLNPEFERPPSDGGAFGLRLKVEDRDDVGSLAIRWASGADAGGTLVSGLPTADGGGTLTYSIDTRSLPPATAYYLQVEVQGFDGQRCAVWWPGYLPGNPAKEAGVPDAGATDAGAPDAGVHVTPPPRGCGCSFGGAPMLGIVAVIGGRFGRRRRSG